MLEIASQMLLCLLLAALLGFIIGYIFGKNTCAKDTCGHTTDIQHHDSTDTHDAHNIVSSSSITDTKPVLLPAPRNDQKDNLTRIKGIGIKIEEALNTIGIYHFDQIAAWDEENIAWADSTLGFPGRAKREDWVAQSQALALGEETAFSKRVDAGEVSTSKQA